MTDQPCRTVVARFAFDRCSLQVKQEPVFINQRLKTFKRSSTTARIVVDDGCPRSIAHLLESFDLGCFGGMIMSSESTRWMFQPIMILSHYSTKSPVHDSVTKFRSNEISMESCSNVVVSTITLARWIQFVGHSNHSRPKIMNDVRYQ